MKSKHTASELKRLALDCALTGCEARAFAAYHTGTLDAANHIEYVEAFVLGAPAQHFAILELLASVERGFRAGKIAYKPRDAPQLSSILDVGRWVTQRLEGGLMCAALLDRTRRGDAGMVRMPLDVCAEIDETALKAMHTLEQCQLFVPRETTFDLITRHTRLLTDFATYKTLSGDGEVAALMADGKAGLLQLFDRGAQDRKELETLVCAALRARGGLVFTSSEFLVDRELVTMLREEDRPEGVRRADVYMIVEDGAITFEAYTSCRTSVATFFKQAVRLGLVVGVSVKSDFGLRNQRATSGELHRCPIVLFLLPHVNERAGTLSDVMVYANVHPRFSVASGKIRYLGAQPIKGTEDRRRTLTSMQEVRCALHPCEAFWAPCVSARCRASLATVETKMRTESWHPLVLFSMGSAQIPETDDWPPTGMKRSLTD